MLDQALVSRCFKWHTVCLRKFRVDGPITAKDCKMCIEKALESLPCKDTDVVYGVVIKQELIMAGPEIELETVIYWKEK